MRYLPATGSGQPKENELDRPPVEPGQGAGNIRPQGIGCTFGATMYVRLTVSYNGRTFPLRHTKVAAWDDNPWLAPSFLGGGYTDADGYFGFQRPTCDFGAWWDYSGPDVYFTVETVDAFSLGVFNILAPILNATYSVRTGTNWDANGSTLYVNLNGGNSDAENAFWAFKMAQLAQEYNVAAGGAGADYFPLRIAWPSRIPFGYTSFAPVAKLELFGSHWLDPYIVWHEFGHELMYRTSTPDSYMWAFNGGAFSMTMPSFAFGMHDGFTQENYQLAYNEGWANYLYKTLSVHYGLSTTVYLYPYDICSRTFSCSAWPVGGENELRISTFLYQYTDQVLRPNLGNSFRNGFGAIRSRLWNVGRYNVDIHEAWPWWLRSSIPGGYVPGSSLTWLDRTREIAYDTYMDLSRIP
ncbi:MAG: hypothetical protein HC933_02790 [Pleurocapsa sp. SU_196_0]|nr:hypothetical protein [Pleurocapsa sp. SU_196_0]